ncbi:MAG: twin-arginine translocation signal domain-containing protein [Candidatus Thermoplasmatota archaeon]|jgi:Rieske Fe-S protein
MAGPISRRDFVKGAAVAGASAVLGVGALSRVLPMLSDDPPGPAPIVRRDPEMDTLTPVTLADLVGDPVVVHVGEWGSLPAIVYKVRRATLEASSRLRGYNTAQHAIQHPSDSTLAILAYGGQCTHLGCTVGFNRTLGASTDVDDYDGDGVREGRVMCPCHQSQFDVFDLGRNMPGQPAKRPLDVLPIRLGEAFEGSPTLVASRRIVQGAYRSADLQGLGASFRLP